MKDHITIIETIHAIAASLDPLAAVEFGTVERLQLKRAMEMCGMATLPELIGEPEGERCSGVMLCEKCQMAYMDHPLDWRLIGHGNVPFLNILCDGRRVKL